MCKCDKCGATVCKHCGVQCNQSCDKARLDKLEAEIAALKAKPAQIQILPQPYPVYPERYIPIRRFNEPYVRWTCGAGNAAALGKEYTSSIMANRLLESGALAYQAKGLLEG